MATPTLAPPNPQQLFAEIVQTFAPPSYPKRQPGFRVFPTGTAKYHWRIVALTSNRAISRHKSLTFALKKCIRLNEQHSSGGQK